MQSINEAKTRSFPSMRMKLLKNGFCEVKHRFFSKDNVNVEIVSKKLSSGQSYSNHYGLYEYSLRVL